MSRNLKVSVKTAYRGVADRRPTRRRHPTRNRYIRAEHTRGDLVQLGNISLVLAFFELLRVNELSSTERELRLSLKLRDLFRGPILLCSQLI